MRKSSSAICQFYKSSRGCKFGTNCKFVHSFSPDIPDSTSNDGSLSSRFINSSITANQQNSSRSLQIRNKDDSIRKATAPNKTSNTSKLCYNFIKNGNCRFGSECRFSHQREELDDTDGVGYSASTGARSERPKTRNTFLKDKPDVRSRKRPKPICQYYQAGSCRKGNECKFRHVGKAEEFIGELTFAQQDSNFENLVVEKAQELTIDDKPAENAEKEASDKSNKVRVESTSIKHQEALRDEEQTKLKRQNRIQRRPFIPVGNFIQELKRETATDEEILHERSVEIEQLKKRFTTEKLTVLPKVDDKDVFHLIFSSSDPDWPYDVKLFELEIVFPNKYPLQPLDIILPEEQNLPETVRRYVEVSIQEWIEEKMKQDEKRRVITKVFRPFLKWFDKNLENIVTEGLKQLQRELMAKAAGMEFIPASQLKKEQASSISNEEVNDSKETDSSSEGEEPEFTIYRKDDANEEVYVGPIDSASSGEEYDYVEDQATEKRLDVSGTEVRGTEIRLRNLQLRDAASTLVVHQIKLVIQCTRCHNRMDIKTPPGQINAVSCQKCNQSQLVNFRPVIAHQFSSVIGYLDVEGCTPFDLVMMDCNFKLGCMRCSKETNVKGLSPGQLLDVSCFCCYQKMKIAADSTRFSEISPSFVDKGDAVNVPVMKIKKIPKDPRIMLGSPLPDDGTCKHYRKSFRWFRFPCCGKCYPCDVCHDEKEDHEMVMANGMICGHCCKEQPFALEKPCKGCHQLMTKSRSSHWEGGKGCRDKTKMSKDDAKKYVNTNKTVSRKQQAKTKPAKKKEAINK